MGTETEVAAKVSDALHSEAALVLSHRDFAALTGQRRRRRRISRPIAIASLVLALVALGLSIAVVDRRGAGQTPKVATGGHHVEAPAGRLGGSTLDEAGFTVKSLTGSIPSLALCAPVPIADHHYLPLVSGGAVAEKNADGGCIEAVTTNGNAPSLSGSPRVDPLSSPGVLTGPTSIKVGQYTATAGTVPSDGTEVLIVQYPDPTDPVYHYDLVITATGMTVAELEAAVQSHPPQLSNGEPPPPCGPPKGCG